MDSENIDPSTGPKGGDHLVENKDDGVKLSDDTFDGKLGISSSSGWSGPGQSPSGPCLPGPGQSPSGLGLSWPDQSPSGPDLSGPGQSPSGPDLSGPPYHDDGERAAKRAKLDDYENEVKDFNVGNTGLLNAEEMVVCTNDHATSGDQITDLDNLMDDNYNDGDNNDDGNNDTINDSNRNGDTKVNNDDVNCINDGSIIVPTRSHKKRRKEESYTGVGLCLSRLIDLEDLIKSGLICSYEMWEVLLIVANMNDNQSHEFLRTSSRYLYMFIISTILAVTF